MADVYGGIVAEEPCPAEETSDMAVIKGITKARYLELTQLAMELCKWLKKRNVQKYEACKLRRITEDLLELRD